MGWGMAVSRRSRRDFGITALGGAAAIFALVSVSAHAEPVEEFFSGRQIKFVIGSAGGGGYESYSPLITPHFSPHPPRPPLLLISEMPRAARLGAANLPAKIPPPPPPELPMLRPPPGIHPPP